MSVKDKKFLESEQRFLTGENFYAQHLLGVHKEGENYIFVFGHQMHKKCG